MHYNVSEEQASIGNIRTEFKNVESLPLAMMFSKGRQKGHKERESSVKVRDSKTWVDLHTGAVHILRLPCTLILISAHFLQQSSLLLVDLCSIYSVMYFQSHFHPQQQMQTDSSQKNITSQQNTRKQNLQGIKEHYISNQLY